MLKLRFYNTTNFFPEKIHIGAAVCLYLFTKETFFIPKRLLCDVNNGRNLLLGKKFTPMVKLMNQAGRKPHGLQSIKTTPPLIIYPYMF